jgi:hypothetical protein
MVAEFSSLYDLAPQREPDLLLHNDPLALAYDLVGQDWNEITQARLDRFNETRKPALKR